MMPIPMNHVTLADSDFNINKFRWKRVMVDPIVASFSGGAVGVISGFSALMVVEINNVKHQEQKRCKYCLGTGYLVCARCSSMGALFFIEPVATVNGKDQPLSPPKTERCSKCSGSAKGGHQKLCVQHVFALEWPSQATRP